MNWLDWFLNGEAPRVWRGKRPFVTRTRRLRIWTRDLGRCRYCGRFGFWWQMELDHVRAWSRGGRNWRNLVLACPECNGRKSNHSGWTPSPLRWWQRVWDWLLIIALWDFPGADDL